VSAVREYNMQSIYQWMPVIQDDFIYISFFTNLSNCKRSCNLRSRIICINLPNKSQVPVSFLAFSGFAFSLWRVFLWWYHDLWLVNNFQHSSHEYLALWLWVSLCLHSWLGTRNPFPPVLHTWSIWPILCAQFRCNRKLPLALFLYGKWSQT
jgi:hypothetical protein